MKQILLHHSTSFEKRYNSLSCDQQNFLKMSSICYEKTARSKLRMCLSIAGIQTEQGTDLKQKDVKPIVTMLEATGMVTSDNMGLLCNPDYVEYLTCQALFDGQYEQMARAAQELFHSKNPWDFEHSYTKYRLAMRDLRFALYGKKSRSTVLKHINYAIQVPDNYYEPREDPLFMIFANPANKALLLYLPTDVADLVWSDMLISSSQALFPLQGMWETFKELCEKDARLKKRSRHILHFQYLLRGETCELSQSLTNPQDASDASYLGFIKLMEGDHSQALMHYQEGLDLLSREVPKAQLFFNNFPGIFYVVALLREASDSSLKLGISYLNRIIKKKKEYLFPSLATDLKQTLLIRQGEKGKAGKIHNSSEAALFNDYFSLLFGYLTLYWQGDGMDSIDEEHLLSLLDAAKSAEYHWVSLQTAALLARTSSSSQHKKILSNMQKECPDCLLLADLIPPQEKWQQVLNALMNLDGSKGAGAHTPAQSRMVWLIDFLDDDDYYDEIAISPRLQKQNKAGKWSKGRAVAIKTLFNHQKLDYLSDHDRKLCSAIKTHYEHTGYYYGRKKIYAFDMKLAIPALIDHPLLFSEDTPRQPLEFVKREPQLHITESKKGYTISLEPDMDSDEPHLLLRETLTRTGVVQMNRGFKRVAEIIDSTIEVPKEAKDMVIKVVSAMAPHLAVHTDIAGVAPDVEEIKADATPYFHLIPFGEGLRAESLVKPFSDGEAFHHPGLGGKVVLAEIEGKKFQARRNLKRELQQADEVIAKCPVLSHTDEGNWEWTIAEPEECLELVSQLQDLKDEVIIQWPQQESFRVSATVEASAFGMRVKGDNDWFAASGELTVDAQTVISMKKLLELSRESSSRFIQMDNGQFLALSKSLKRRIEELDAFSEDFEDGVRFSPLASLALDEFSSEMGKVTGDKQWKDNLKRFSQVTEPQLPSTFQAELRDYQQAGFHWLATLSQWGVGACLADDMGLGKTVQALAAILLRAAQGPTLVIAPTSVLMNWNDEAARFAPTLRVLAFGPGDRQNMLDSLGPFDLVVSSYGLLQSEGERLAGVSWQTIVLDEAQAIKNMATKRSKAAMKLMAEFRIITTGTPIENHLGELWNLFQFINPGLLGSADSFNQKFAIPIEKYRDRQTRNRLKKLIQPYILRRLKQDVLQELPPRTEVTLQVEMSQDEMAMYEAQRSQALEKIAEAEESGSGQHMQILAEITRLRRFCCNPELVVPGCGISSSKLRVFKDTVRELLDNGHKALVFSQFVGHLDILRKSLDEQNIAYQYLDGSTPLKKRQKRIRAFQAGEGDIFLISLKAGGAGLNLTAADFVIHMDPWWNPAVEDQASDRAHRIGQKRPVTVYRLVVKESIEEKIIALHAHKRDLASNLLEGADMAGKISTAQLLDLMKS
jgi:SNF2 family DNA or RNA helicase